jgi:methionine-rich copper-binding protein CopC
MRLDRFASRFWFGLVLLVFPSLACAHAILLFSTPSASAILKGPEIEVQLRFNSRIDAKRSRLTLTRPNGALESLTIGEQSSPDLLNTQIKGLRSGAFVLRWQVLATDGHITRGEIPFRVE